jgi:metal-responsive CopG/Arc/MetJ family transcriptional regulator
MKKIAITIPDAQLQAIERIRRQRKIPRSRVIQQAVSLYLAEAGLAEGARAYEEGYRRRPERDREAQAFAHAAAEVLGGEDWS